MEQINKEGMQMKSSKIAVMVTTMLTIAGSAFAVGGILPDGQGTNVVYGDIYGQGLYYLRDLDTYNINGRGITNLNWDAVTNKPTIPSTTDFLTTNATAQTKDGQLTLNGGLVVSNIVVLIPSAVQTIAEGAVITADAASVQVAGDGGAVTASFADGATAGQVLAIRGTSDANSVTLTNAPVVPTFKLGAGDAIQFTWGTAWTEDFRRDN
jgi:hypothetical protein